MAGFVKGMAAQRCEAPLTKADSSDRLQATIQYIFSHKCYKKACRGMEKAVVKVAAEHGAETPKAVKILERGTAKRVDDIRKSSD